MGRILSSDHNKYHAAILVFLTAASIAHAEE